MKTKLDPGVFVKAAKLVHRDKWPMSSTDALYEVTGKILSPENKFFIKRFLFKPGETCFHGQDHRIFALLLAAELAKESSPPRDGAE